jgi:hypothetical protein
MDRQQIAQLVEEAGQVLEEVSQRPTPLVQRDFHDQLVYKTHEQIMPQQQEMDAATQAAWDNWLAASLDRFMQETIIPVVGEALGMAEKELMEEFTTKLDALRAEANNGARKKLRGEIVRKRRDG